MEEVKQTYRRYREGRDFHYDYQWASEARQSAVLNGEYQAGEMDYLLEAKEKRLQMLEDDLQDIIAAQKLAKQNAFNKGEQYIEQDRSREKRVTIEARIDVVKWEISALEEAIEEAERAKEEKEIPPCLASGPEGINSVPGSIGKGFVDGQFCSHVENVGLVITDERSKYRGMLVMDYIEHIAKPWLRASSEYKNKVVKEGKDLEIFHGSGRGSLHVPWPEIPVDVQRYLSNGNGQVSTSKPKMIRTRYKR